MNPSGIAVVVPDVNHRHANYASKYLPMHTYPGRYLEWIPSHHLVNLLKVCFTACFPHSPSKPSTVQQPEHAMPDEVKDKNSEPIHEGDLVWTKIRSGSHEGTVRKIVMTEEEALKEGVKHPPKVSKRLSMLVACQRKR